MYEYRNDFEIPEYDSANEAARQQMESERSQSDADVLQEMMEECWENNNSKIDETNCIATASLAEQMKLYKSLKQKKDALEKEMAKLKDHITMQMGEAVTLINTDGELLATWSWSKPVERFDTKKFKEDMPSVYMQYLKAGAPVRSFLVK